MVDFIAFAGGVDKRRDGCYLISKSGETYGRRTCCHICWESERRGPSLGHEDVKTTMVYTHVDMLSGAHGTLVSIHMRHDDENSVLSQRLDISLVTPKARLYLPTPCAAIVAVFRVLCGSI
jgi:hypothetical protein